MLVIVISLAVLVPMGGIHAEEVVIESVPAFFLGVVGHRTPAIMRWIVATTTLKMAVATMPIRTIRRMSTSPPANREAEVAPAYGNATPIATCAIRIAIDAGLNPTFAAAGMNMPQ